MSGASGLRRHGHSSSGDGGALGAAAPTSLVIPSTASPAQTAEGEAKWDSDDDKLTIGTGSGRKTMVNEGGSLSLLGAPTADFSIGSHKLTNVTNPGSAQDAATKAYVDSTVAGAGGLSDQGVITYLDATVAAAPAAPSAGYIRVYAKTGGHLAQKDSSNVETLLDSSGGGAIASDTIWDAKGDLAVATAADTASRLAVGSNGQVLTADSGETTGVKWATPSAGGGFDPLTTALIYDDCFFSTTSQTLDGGLGYLFSGTSATVGFVGGVATIDNHPGIVDLRTGTDTTGRSAIGITTRDMSWSAGLRFGVVAGLSVLSDGTNRYMVRMGYADRLHTFNTHTGIFFRYSDNNNSGKWQAVVRDDSNVETAADTGVTAVADINAETYSTFEFEVAADFSSVEFFIDGSSVANITPSGGCPTTGIQLYPATISKSAGTSSRSLYIDAYWYKWTITR